MAPGAVFGCGGGSVMTELVINSQLGWEEGLGTHLFPTQELSFLLSVCQRSLHRPVHVTRPPSSHAHPNPFSISLRFRGACRCGQASSSLGQYVLWGLKGVGLGFLLEGRGH